MGQYITGTVDVTNGSQNVVGIGTEWTTYINVGDSFKVEGINTIYEIGAVTDDTHISLSANWAGSTLVNQNYQITVDFTPNFNLTEIWAGDRDWPYHLTRTIREIDRLFQWIVDRTASSATTTTTTTTTTSSTTSTTSTSSTTTTTA